MALHILKLKSRQIIVFSVCNLHKTTEMISDSKQKALLTGRCHTHPDITEALLVIKIVVLTCLMFNVLGFPLGYICLPRCTENKITHVLQV